MTATQNNRRQLPEPAEQLRDRLTPGEGHSCEPRRRPQTSTAMAAGHNGSEVTLLLI